MNDIQLRCPKCGFSKIVDPDDTDPPHTAVVELLCLNCETGTFAAPRYFDIDGNELKPVSLNI